MENAYIDLSPTYLLEDIVTNKTNKYMSTDVPVEAKTSVSNLIKYLINIIGEDKIVFGSDYPWGSLDDAKKLYDSLDLTQVTKDKIFKHNFENFNKIGVFNKSKQPEL